MMAGTGFLDGFKEKKGNYEPPTKTAGSKKAAAAPRPATKEEREQFIPPDTPSVEHEQSLDEEPPVDEPSPSPPKVKSKPNNNKVNRAHTESHLSRVNPTIATMIANARQPMNTPQAFVMCGIAGHPKTGKTGMVLDSLTPQEVKAGAEIWHIDFDLGGETTKAAHHSDKAENMVILNPWVFNYGESRVPYDFPATFQQTIDILKTAKSQMEAQAEYFAEHGKMPKPYLKTVVFDGADHWLHITETCMKVDDLDLGVDGIAVSGKKTTTQIGRFNWNIRATRYQTAMVAMRELCRGGVHCYIITHMKPGYDKNGNELAGQDTPKWLKDTEGHLQQVIYTELEEERNESGEMTGVVRGYAVIVADRTSLQSSGRVMLFERNDDGGVWHGWPGIKEGDFTVTGGDE
jgi:hypothetical protein